MNGMWQENFRQPLWALRLKGKRAVTMAIRLSVKFRMKIFQSGWVQSAFRGIHEALENGVIAGYPILGVKVSVTALGFEEESAHEAAFQIAGSMALREALKGAACELMEPVFFLEVLCPKEFLGAVIGDLNSRRAKVIATTMKNHLQMAEAETPLAELSGYSTDLRSLTQGRGTFAMKFLRYECLPERLQKEMLQKMGRL